MLRKLLFLVALCTASKSYLYEVHNEVKLAAEIAITDANLCQIRSDLEDLACLGFSTCNVILDSKYNSDQCSGFPPITVTPTTTTTTAATRPDETTPNTTTTTTKTTTAYNPPVRPPYPVPMEVVMDVGWSYLGLNVAVCAAAFVAIVCDIKTLKSVLTKLLMLVFILSTVCKYR